MKKYIIIEMLEVQVWYSDGEGFILNKNLKYFTEAEILIIDEAKFLISKSIDEADRNENFECITIYDDLEIKVGDYIKYMETEESEYKINYYIKIYEKEEEI